MTAQTSFEILSEAGPLANKIPGFASRHSQQEMAQRIEQALAEQEVFIAESGTGTGKTLAYLVPALLSGKKIIISTGTKNLQDQLFRRDLPLIRDALGFPVNVALLKGRANYLCRYRLAHTGLERRIGNVQFAELARIQDWAGRTRTGDIAELSDVPEDSEWWPMVTSTADNCLGTACDQYETCYVNRARREALAADVLVINHHLFFADLALREDGFARLLPGADAVIFDEAHQLPEIAANFFGLALSSRQLLDLCRDTVTEERKEQSAVAGLAQAAQAVEKAVADFRLSFGVAPHRAAWHKVEQQNRFYKALTALKEQLADFSSRLEAASAKGEGLANCARRCQDLLDRFFTISESPHADHVVWYETTVRGFVLHLTPLNIAAIFRQQLEGYRKAWIFTSATLAVGDSFAHFQSQLGLEQAATARWDSPFDYAKQGLLYIPPDLPEPAAADYTRRVIAAALPVLEASRGRAFLLFTSHRALKQAVELLTGKIAFPLLIQGSAPRSELLGRFRAAGNAVLLGTGSFWEGVDVRGDALSCVIIDKLPFAAPDDPLLQARGEALAEAGRSLFLEYQLPNAVIALKQGVGRLIRDVDDRGVLMLCDPRLTTKGYGKAFLDSLPAMPRTQHIAEVKKFFRPGLPEAAGLPIENTRA